MEHLALAVIAHQLGASWDRAIILGVESDAARAGLGRVGMGEPDGERSDEVYPFRGVPLTPLIIVYLAPRLFSGQVVSRQELIGAVVARHRALGGLLNSGVPVAPQAKRAINMMYASGIATNAGRGHYRFHANADDDGESREDETLALDADLDLSEAEAPAYDLPPEREIGVGPEVEYVYYLPTYRRLAEVEGRDRWPCKVGYTGGLLLTRILGQANTALPEVPVVGLKINGHRCRDLEKAIHGVLGYNARKRVVPGTEWFDTSPAEVERIYESLIASLADATPSASDSI
jgi:hypothetical protein